MSPAEKRLETLKENLKNEPDKNSLYAQDLKLSIEQLEPLIKNLSKDGYKMVKV